VTDTPGSWATGSEMEQIEAVQSTLVSAFQIPEWDRDVVLDLYDANRGIVSTGRYTRIEIIGIAARSKECQVCLVQDHRRQPQGRRRAARLDSDLPHLSPCQ
jgi:hypothetical protein